MANNSNTQP